MKDDGAPHPVDLLRDRRGVYGIGVSELFDFEVVAWSCGVEPEPHTFESPPGALILRPDSFAANTPLRPDSLAANTPLGADSFRPLCAVLQKITGGFRRGPFRRSHEEQLRQFIHHEALNRSGLPWPPRQQNDLRWWSEDKKQQMRNRGVYHGLRRSSLNAINHLVGRALEEAADAVKAARHFTFEHRERIYRAAALSRRALQLTETFPVLALAIYSERWQARRYGEPSNTEIRFNSEAAELSSRKTEAMHLVDRGARLRDVAVAMNIPMALRHIKPGVAHLASSVICTQPGLLHFIPDTVPKARIWLRLVPWACNRVSAEFAEWVARHTPQIPGSLNHVGGVLGNIADWARAGMPLEEVVFGHAGSEFVVRPFTPSMSLKTATALSADWHEAVANNLDGPNFAFPDPWFPAAKLGDYEILPIEDSASLYREGTAMHHCVGTYGDEVRRGDCYVYSIRRNYEPVATVALCRDNGRNGRTYLEQIRGRCNTQPPKAIVATVVRWLHSQRPLPPI